MADRRIRDLRRLLESLAEPYRAAVVVEHTRGNHLRGTFTMGAQQAFIITGFSPSDWRVARKVKAAARRTLRELADTSAP